MGRKDTKGKTVQTLLHCKKFDVVRREETAPDGTPFQREIVVHPGAVVVLPLIDDSRCLLLRQFRPAVEKELWELPAGTLDVTGESPETAAARELEEEAGYRAGRWSYLCEFYPSPGILTERMRIYVAEKLTATARRPDKGEQITGVDTVRLDDAIQMILDGRIVDGKTMITLLRWNLKRTNAKS